MQMVERPWGMSVSGSATVKAAPDLARIRFRIVRTEPTPAEAFDVTRAAVRGVRDALRARGVADEAVDGSRLGLVTVTNYVDGASVVAGYQCQASFSIESPALDDVHQECLDVVAAGANEIESVEFDVSTRDALLADARRAAVAAARAKAEVYASAAGVRLGAVVHLEDASSGGGPHLREMAVAADTSLAPGSLAVSASVVVGYALAP